MKALDLQQEVVYRTQPSNGLVGAMVGTDQPSYQVGVITAIKRHVISEFLWWKEYNYEYTIKTDNKYTVRHARDVYEKDQVVEDE